MFSSGAPALIAPLSLSNVLTLNLVPDTVAPQIVSVDPADGTARREGLQYITQIFAR